VASNGRDGPAMRPRALHAAVSGVGEHTARESEAPNVCAGKERVATAHPQVWPRDANPGAFLFLATGPVSLALVIVLLPTRGSV
jgi:hypothetical protein